MKRRNRAGRRLCEQVKQERRAFVRRNPVIIACAVMLYPAMFAAVTALSSAYYALTDRRSPLDSSFGRGVTVGIAITGACWWFMTVRRLAGASAARYERGADGEEFTEQALRPLRWRGWRVVHDIEFPGQFNVDHVAVG